MFSNRTVRIDPRVSEQVALTVPPFGTQAQSDRVVMSAVRGLNFCRAPASTERVTGLVEPPDDFDEIPVARPSFT